MDSERTFLRDIARQAGVAVSTVSRALRNDRQVSRQTARRIQALAQRLRYRPDPALVSLAAYRSGKNPPHRYGKLAVLAHWEGKGLALHIQEILEGIQARSKQLGFDTGLFNVPAEKLEQAKLARKLDYQGIRGIIVTPLPLDASGFLWKLFSVAGIGENATSLKINYVGFDHDHALSETYRQLRAKGYRKIGFLNSFESEERNRFLFIASYFKCLHRDGFSPSPPYLYREKRSGLLAWLRENDFDAVMSDGVLRADLAGTEFINPRRFGHAVFAASLAKATGDRVAAYIVDGNHLGAMSVDFLQSLMQKNQTGIPDSRNQYSINIRGVWRDDRTLAGQGSHLPRAKALSILPKAGNRNSHR